MRFRKAGDNMSTEIRWIKICTDIFDDEKILLIESMPDADSIIVIWFKLLCLAGKQNNDGIFVFNGGFPYTVPMLAAIFRRKESTVDLALKTFEKFKMVEIVEGTITIPNWQKHQNTDRMRKIREDTRLRNIRYRERQKALAEQGETERDASCDAFVTNQEVRIRSKKEEINNNIYPASDTAKNSGFEAVWTIYPRKKDKAAARKAYDARLRDGWSPDELLSAVKAYAAECRREKRDEKYTKHGATFFGASTPFSDYIPKHDAQFVDDLNGVI